jgi:hypothetical protein
MGITFAESVNSIYSKKRKAALLYGGPEAGRDDYWAAGKNIAELVLA